MKLKLNDDYIHDKYGGVPFAYISGNDATPQRIFDKIWEQCGGAGYKFAIIIDVSHDEYEEPEKETPIYYLDELFTEMCEYIGIEHVKKKIDELYNKMSK